MYKKLKIKINIIAATIFTLIWLAQLNGSKWSQSFFNAFSASELGIYTTASMCTLFLISLGIYYFYKRGWPKKLLIVSLFWVVNLVFTAIIGGEIPIHLLVTMPIIYFLSINYIFDYLISLFVRANEA